MREYNWLHVVAIYVNVINGSNRQVILLQLNISQRLTAYNNVLMCSVIMLVVTPPLLSHTFKFASTQPYAQT